MNNSLVIYETPRTVLRNITDLGQDRIRIISTHLVRFLKITISLFDRTIVFPLVSLLKEFTETKQFILLIAVT